MYDVDDESPNVQLFSLAVKVFNTWLQSSLSLDEEDGCTEMSAQQKGKPLPDRKQAMCKYVANYWF